MKNIYDLRKSKIYAINQDRDGNIWVSHSPSYGFFMKEKIVLDPSPIDYIYKKNYYYRTFESKTFFIDCYQSLSLLKKIRVKIYRINFWFKVKKIQLTFFWDTVITKRTKHCLIDGEWVTTTNIKIP